MTRRTLKTCRWRIRRTCTWCGPTRGRISSPPSTRASGSRVHSRSSTLRTPNSSKGCPGLTASPSISRAETCTSSFRKKTNFFASIPRAHRKNSPPARRRRKQDLRPLDLRIRNLPGRRGQLRRPERRKLLRHRPIHVPRRCSRLRRHRRRTRSPRRLGHPVRRLLAAVGCRGGPEQRRRLRRRYVRAPGLALLADRSRRLRSNYSGGIALPFDFEFLPTNIAVAAGRVYLKWRIFFGTGEVRAYSTSDFEASPPEAPPYTVLTSGARGLATDPSTGDVYVDKGNRIEVFDSAGSSLETFGTGVLSFSSGLAVSARPGPTNHHTYATSNRNRIVDFGHFLPPYAPIDHPAVVHGVGQPQTHTYGDFQVSRSGRFAAFGSILALTGFENGGSSQVFRYDDTGPVPIECASCNPTNALPEGDAKLARGRLQPHRRREGLLQLHRSPCPRSTSTARQDVYEWIARAPQLISTGNSPFDSSLLGVSADGDRRLLLHPGHAGPGGPEREPREDLRRRRGRRLPLRSAACPLQGLRRVPRRRQPRPPPPPRSARSRGSGGNATGKKRCKRGQVKKRGKCVRKKRQRNGVAEDIKHAGADEMRRERGDQNEARRPASRRVSRRRSSCVSRASRSRGRRPADRILLGTLLRPRPAAIPDLDTTFTLAEPGVAGGGQERHLQRSGGDLRKPERDHPVHLRRLRAHSNARRTRRRA